MNADEPRVRRRGYFLTESSSDSEFVESDSAEGIYTFRVARPRRARKAVTGSGGRHPRHRAAVSSQVPRSGEKKAAGARSETSTGTRRP